MKAHFLLLLLIFLSIYTFRVQATFMEPHLENVPVDRILANLQKQLAATTNEVRDLYLLARVHSMAYATNLTVVPQDKRNHEPEFYGPWNDVGVPQHIVIRTNAAEKAIVLQHLTNAIALYERAAVLVVKGKNYEQNQWIVLPIYIGHAWCLDQAGRKQDAIKAYRKALQLAWRKEVEGESNFKEWLDWSWDQIRALKLPVGRPNHGFIGPGVCYSNEIIGYLLRLLDPKKDAKEIAQLQADQKALQKIPRAITPILVPMQDNVAFEELVDASAGVCFDLDGTGQQRRWGWITSKAAWLVFDRHGSSKITSGLQMFGGVTFWIFWRNGYEALSSLDNNADGKLKGDELDGISLWHDRDGNGISDAGEVIPARQAGIVALECAAVAEPNGIPFHPQGVVFQDSRTRPTFDWMVPTVNEPEVTNTNLSLQCQ